MSLFTLSTAMAAPTASHFYGAHDDGTQQHAIIYCPKENPKGLVMVLHGLQGYAASYPHLGDLVVEEGWAGMLVDRRGSGESQSRRGDARDDKQMVDDVVQAAQEFRAKVAEICPDVKDPSQLPLRIIGNSFSVKTSLAAALRYKDTFKVQGIFLNTPVLFQQKQAEYGFRAKLQLLGWRMLGMLSGSFLERNFPSPLRDHLLSSDPVVQGALREDPKALREASVRFWFAAKKLNDEVIRRFRELRVPLEVVLAGDDSIVDVKRTQIFFSEMRNLGVPIHVETVGGCDHLIDQSAEKEKVFSLLRRWLET